MSETNNHSNNELHQQSVKYRCCQLDSDQITTIIFGGGGAYGFLYLGLIKFCEEQQVLKQLKEVIGVSVGSMISLFLALGYTYQEIYNSVMHEIDLSRILEITADNIFNILDQLGINNGAYVEETIKNIISAKGLSPYLTFRDLTDAQLGPQLNIGYTRSFHNDFFVANAKTTPDMPIWLAVRASIAIPVILTPVVDYTSQDILCDGGLVNNTPIKWYLADWWQRNPVKHKACATITHPYTTSKDAETQTSSNSDTLDSTPDTNTNNTNSNGAQLANILEQHQSSELPAKKFRQHFWCCEIKTLTDSPINHSQDLKNITLTTYLSWVIHKIFANQDASRDKYSKYLCQLDAKDYPEINRERFDLDVLTRELIITRAYENYKKYFQDYLLAPMN
jgi:predicted acylesterase/phospholipase RssA